MFGYSFERINLHACDSVDCLNLKFFWCSSSLPGLSKLQHYHYRQETGCMLKIVGTHVIGDATASIGIEGPGRLALQWPYRAPFRTGLKSVLTVQTIATQWLAKIFVSYSLKIRRDILPSKRLEIFRSNVINCFIYIDDLARFSLRRKMFCRYPLSMENIPLSCQITF